MSEKKDVEKIEEKDQNTPKEDPSQKNDDKKVNPVLLNRTYRFIAYLIMVTTEMAMNVSSGVLSASSKAIKRQYTMKDVEFGYFGLA